MRKSSKTRQPIGRSDVHKCMRRPYWFNGGLNNKGRLALAEWEALPADLQPLLRNWLSEADREPSAVQAKMDRGEAADAQNAWGFARVGEEGLEHANAHIRVRVAKL